MNEDRCDQAPDFARNNRLADFGAKLQNPVSVQDIRCKPLRQEDEHREGDQAERRREACNPGFGS